MMVEHLGRRGRRVLVAALLVLVAVAVALPTAYAGRPSPTATATFTNNGNCTVTVTYTWSGFKGRNLTPSYGVYYVGSGGIDVGILFQNDPPGPGTGSSTQTFDLTGKGAHTYYGRGSLLNSKGQQVAGSDAWSATRASLSC